MTPNVPLGSLQGVEALVLFATQIFASIFSLFHHQNVPVAAAPAITAQLQATPGLTPDHQAVIATAVTQAVAAHQASV